MFGAVAVCLGSGLPLEEAARFAPRRAPSTFTRHGLGSGAREAIERLVPEIVIRAVRTESRALSDAEFEAEKAVVLNGR